MTDTPVVETLSPVEEFLSSKFEKDLRPGFFGFMIPKELLVETVTALKMEHGFDVLTSITALDLFPEDQLDIIYHFRKLSGGEPLEIKVVLGRDHPAISSIMSIYPGAELQEREIYDLFGVHFDDHPDLRRILTWEGFHGHPLRKDWKEPFFEEEIKPYKSRWPEGHVKRIEDVNPFHDNLQYPAGFDPEHWEADNDQALYASLKMTAPGDGESLKTDMIVVNIGPQHPSTHGVFRMVAVLDGETIVDLKPVMGYLHRNHEKIGERNTFLQNMPFTDRLDYICSMSE